MYKRIASLHLDAILYGTNIRNRCRRNGEWTLGTFAFLLLELREYEGRVEILDAAAILRYQQIIEVAREYFHAHVDGIQAGQFDYQVRRALSKAAERVASRLGTTPTESQATEFSLIRHAADKIGTDLDNLLPGA